MADQFAGFDSIATFNTDAVLEAMRRTMVFGLPQDDADKPTFYFDPTAVWADPDSEGNPWDWDTVPDSGSGERSAVQVVCAYEFSPGNSLGTISEVGDMEPNNVVLTMFREEFEEVQGFAYVTVGPVDSSGERTKYHFRFWKPLVGFGEAEVFEVYCSATGIA